MFKRNIFIFATHCCKIRHLSERSILSPLFLQFFLFGFAISSVFSSANRGDYCGELYVGHGHSPIFEILMKSEFHLEEVFIVWSVKAPKLSSKIVFDFFGLAIWFQNLTFFWIYDFILFFLLQRKRKEKWRE